MYICFFVLIKCLKYPQVAKESADVVIMDDNFATILNVAKWGRSVYINIQKFVQFQLTVNIVALMINFISACVSGSLKSFKYIKALSEFLNLQYWTTNRLQMHHYRFCTTHCCAVALGEHDHGHSWCISSCNRTTT